MKSGVESAAKSQSDTRPELKVKRSARALAKSELSSMIKEPNMVLFV
jgi:hypothetical protein